MAPPQKEIKAPLQWACLLLLIAAPATTWFLFKREKINAPRLQLANQYCVLDLGSGTFGQVLSGSFRIGNSGSLPLKFSLEAGCVCSALVPREGEIGPGEAEQVKVEIRLQNEGKAENVLIKIQTNDPESPTAEYRVRARCITPLVASPKTIDFGDVSVGVTPPVREVRLFDSYEKPLRATDDLLIETSDPKIQVSQVIAEGGDKGLRVSWDPGVTKGHFFGLIKVRRPNSDKGITIPVSGDLRSRLSVAPSVLLAGLGANGFYEGNFIVSSQTGSGLGKLQDVEKPDGFAIEEVGSGSQGRRLFRVKCGPDGMTALPVTLKLFFEGVPEAVVLRIQGQSLKRSAMPAEITAEKVTKAT